MLQRMTILGLVLATGLAAAGPRISLVQGYSFDPLVMTPRLPAALTVAEYEGENGYYLVQFRGPVLPQWKRDAERLGVELLWYLPQYAFIARVPNARLEELAVVNSVRWVGPYQPAYKLLPGLESVDGHQRLIVVFFNAEDEYELLDEVAALGAFNIVTEFNEWNTSVRLDIDGAQIPVLARLPGVFWIETWEEITPDNMNLQWVDQHGYSASDTTRTVWHKGVNGSSVIVGLTDTQLWMNHDVYRDTVNNTPGPTHRKVIHYLGTQGANNHGTHTGGTLCGSDDYVGGSSWHDGLAKESRLYFQFYSALPTGWDMNRWFQGPDSGVAGLRAFNHSMSLSRKDTYNIYVFSDMTADQFIWNHPEFMHCNSMGNYGTNRMGHPVIAKNIISTGATQNGSLCRSIATFTSRGPTADGRMKPQLVSPGEDIYSASHTNASGYVSLDGTSMSTPNMTAATALIRDYFRKGFYPTGDTTTGTPMEISAALNKAVAIVGADNDVSGYTVPDNNVGWGRVDLDSSLYFVGDPTRLWVDDAGHGLGTGDSALFTIPVRGDSRPFRVALCWSDFPGTMQAALILVNDLDLTVISPTGTEYKGNVWSGGESQIGGIYDTLNVEECFRVNAPEIGDWTVKVNARNVPQGPQPFALAAIGMLAEDSAIDAGVLRILAPSGQVDSGTTVVPTALVRNLSFSQQTFAVRFNIGDGYLAYDTVTLAAGMSDTVRFEDWLAESIAVYVAGCSTMLDGDENPNNDFRSDSFEVLPPTGIEAGGQLPRSYALEAATPNPFSGRTVVRWAVPRQSEVQVAVYSADGRRVRTLHRGGIQAGYYTRAWDGTGDDGSRISHGIYYVRLTTAGFTGVNKLVKAQ